MHRRVAATKWWFDSEVAVRREFPGFWSRVAPADADLALALLQGRLDDATVHEITQQYSVAFADSGPRERASVGEHLEILERAFEGHDSGGFTGQLRKLRDRLAF